MTPKKTFIVIVFDINQALFFFRKNLQQIVIAHLADIDYKDFLKIYRNCTKEPYSFLTIDTTLPADSPMRLRKTFSDFLL